LNIFNDIVVPLTTEEYIDDTLLMFTGISSYQMLLVCLFTQIIIFVKMTIVYFAIDHIWWKVLTFFRKYFSHLVLDQLKWFFYSFEFQTRSYRIHIIFNCYFVLISTTASELDWGICIFMKYDNYTSDEQFLYFTSTSFLTNL
jgi:hypothetical protein